MKRHVSQYPKFLKGINRRFPIESADDPNRLYTIQNGRLYKRGESGQVSRIKGYQALPQAVNYKPFDKVLDVDTYKEFIVVLWTDLSDKNADGLTKQYITLKEIDRGYEIHLPFYADPDTGKLGEDVSCPLLAPPPNVVINEVAGNTEISWDDSPDAAAVGYNVYSGEQRDNDQIITDLNHTIAGTGLDIHVTTVNECGTDKW